MNVLFIGDIVGRPGRAIVSRFLPGLRTELSLDLVIANGENAAGGAGLDLRTADEILHAGVDVMTSGNHIWNRREIFPRLDADQRLVRPGNYARENPGRGHTQVEVKGVPVIVANLLGRIFMGELVECPFRAADALLEAPYDQKPLFIFDFHAEATSEKTAFGRYLDGRAQAVVGTHTHVATADETILPGGCAYITDVGMCGASDGVIGVQSQQVIERFLLGRPVRFEVARGAPMFNGVFFHLDETTRRATEMRRIFLSETVRC